MIFLLLLTGCVTSPQTFSSTLDVNSTAISDVLPTAIPVLSQTQPALVTSELTKCTVDSQGYLQLPGGIRTGGEFRGWTVNDEYYVGGYTEDGMVFCFLQKGFTGRVEAFDRQTGFYAENIPEQVLNAVGRENLYGVFPSPQKDKYLYLKGLEQPQNRLGIEYEVWTWDQEKQEATLIFGVDNEFWRYCEVLLGPEDVRWLSNDLVYMDCLTIENKFVIDIQQKQYTNINDLFSIYPYSFTGYWFPPDGRKYIGISARDFDNYNGLYPLFITDVHNYLQYYQTCLAAGNPESGLNTFFQNITPLPYGFQTFDSVFNNRHIQWSTDSQYLYFKDFNPQHDSYGDILKYDLSSGMIETFVDFEILNKYVDPIDINEQW